MFCNEKGFTLVEVIVASVVLFSAIAIGSLAYRTSVASVDRISANITMADALPAIMVFVKEELENKKNQGEGRYSPDISYSFEAKTAETSKNILSAYDELTGGLEYGSYVITLKNVQLTITCEEEGRVKQAQYNYKELLWEKG
jgi:prepilin-type N-terminal cleavage/methylation domain-containing protein